MAADIAGLIALFQRGAFGEVLMEAERLRRQHTRDPMIDVLAGAAHGASGAWDAAVASHQRALQIDPECVDAHYNLALACHQQGDLVTAEASYRAVTARRPGHAQALNNLGVVLKAQGHAAAAREAFEAAVTAAPGLLDAYVNLAVVLDQLGETQAAEAHFQAALRAAPGLADGWYNYGLLLGGQHRLPEAVAAFTRATKLRPDHAESHGNLGTALQTMGHHEEAAAAFRCALACDPGAAATWTDLGISLADLGDNAGAISAWQEALARDSGYHRALGLMLHRQSSLADWSQRELAAAADPATASPSGPASPHMFLALDDDPARQLQRAEAFSRYHFAAIPTAPLVPTGISRDGRIRVGYFSADFHDHATLYLMAGLLRCHDRNRFEIHAYSYGTVRGGTAREAAAAHTEHFHDVADMADDAVVALARQHALDIAVDCKGYTRDARTALFARRLAPIQINYLGYPGTMGAPFMDYIVGDAVVLPLGAPAHCREAVIRLPGSYQPNDNDRAIAQIVDTRADHGLPPDGFVFASFNSTYKLGPAEWDSWCRMLQAVPGSVLWLLRGEEPVSANLCRESLARGIDPARLIFAPERPQAEHLARMRHADLFLDSFACNAHTTASDALWGGLPVLTMAGHSFTARVAASLLYAVDLAELVTTTVPEYEATALALAHDPQRLAALRERLVVNRTTAPLFDTLRYTRNLEAGLAMAAARHAADLPPADLLVPDCNTGTSTR